MKLLRSLAPPRVWTVTIIGLALVVAGVASCVAGFVDLVVTMSKGGALVTPAMWMILAVALYAVGIPMLYAFAREQRRRKRVASLQS